MLLSCPVSCLGPKTNTFHQIGQILWVTECVWVASVCPLMDWVFRVCSWLWPSDSWDPAAPWLSGGYSCTYSLSKLEKQGLTIHLISSRDLRQTQSRHFWAGNAKEELFISEHFLIPLTENCCNCLDVKLLCALSNIWLRLNIDFYAFFFSRKVKNVPCSWIRSHFQWGTHHFSDELRSKVIL